MKNTVLDNIKNFAIQMLQNEYGYCGCADGDEMAMINVSDKEGNDIEIHITAKKEEKQSEFEIASETESPKTKAWYEAQVKELMDIRKIYYKLYDGGEGDAYFPDLVEKKLEEPKSKYSEFEKYDPDGYKDDDGGNLPNGQ